ncbi:MAG: ketopantoate reductase family protein [Hyphomicrobiaceae bacterium]|nr:MAG: ketopantoate reductase family protein [Hyphomicrobiaceae bacterium]
MRILVLGAGAVGGFFGGHLAKAGADVTFLVRAERAAALRRFGLAVDSPLGDFRASVDVVTDAAAARRPDIVIVTCKAYDIEEVMEAIAPAIGSGTVLLPLLNGIAHLERLSARFPAACLWGGLAHLSVTLAEDGTIRHLNSLSTIRFGARAGVREERIERLAALFAPTPVNAVASPRIDQELWEKFVFIAALAGMTCLMRASAGAIVATPDGERLMLQLLDECRATAAASGFPPDPQQLAKYQTELTRRGSALRASMLRDIERGGRTEGEHILGDMLARARDHGVATPLLEIATTHVRAYEASRRQT